MTALVIPITNSNQLPPGWLREIGKGEPDPEEGVVYKLPLKSGGVKRWTAAEPPKERSDE